MAAELISIGSSVLVRLDKLKNASTDAYVNSATVAFVLKDADGNTIQSSTSMAYIASSDGRYEGVITAANSGALNQDATYVIEITATFSGYTLFRKLSCTARYRSTN
jgi:hypothetical protein